jgi:lysophospholipase
LIEDARVGHVIHFPDYQKDLAAAVDFARSEGAPEPWHLIGHSMGGAIGLRAVMEGIGVSSCAFTGPMWGIYMKPLVRPFGWALPKVAEAVGMGNRLSPSTTYDSYVLANPFADNMLTTDADMFALMRRQLTERPELALGGPSLIWLREALNECRALARRPSPELPCVTFLGERERIIDCPKVHDRMQRWPGGALDIVPGAEHEVLMESETLRNRVFDRLDALFTHGDAGRPEALSA